MKSTMVDGVEYKYYEDSELVNFANMVVAGQLSIDALYDDVCANHLAGTEISHPILKPVDKDPMAAVMTIEAIVKHMRGQHVDNSKRFGREFRKYFQGYLRETMKDYRFVSLVNLQTLEIVPVYVNHDGSIHAEW